MLNANIKQQINTARDILVGKIPDPKGQIDQITNALIYKFMDDQDRLALTLPGGKANFFVNELKPYAWHKLFDGKLSNQDKANLYVEGIAKLSISKHLPDLFRDIFKDAFLPFRAPDTIAMFLGEINKFDYHHSEDLGNAFEYLLSIMGSQGDAGQFRTPRNIIEFIVDAVDPSKDDHILDPACGTAGFLVEAYKHITKDKKLTPNEIQELAQHIHGVDIDPGMAKIARVNLYLHGFKTPLITEDDTLSDERLWGKKYDVILANPPFMTPKGGIVPHDKFSVKSNRAEVLFTDYIAEHLKLAGRAGVVVPEGIIFQSGKVYKQLRKMLVDDNYLWAVVSLPAGVFNPYSGVKTSILLFDRERSAKNTEILFFKVNNDGFDLGAQRREVTKNDLPEALEIIKKWKNGEKVENSKAIYIEKSKIAESDDYKLSIDQYRIATDYTNAKWPMVELKDVCTVDWGNTNLTKASYKEDGQYLAVSATGGDGRIENFEHEVGVTVLSAIGANCGKVFFPEERFTAIKNTITFTPDRKKIFPKYLFCILNANNFPVRGAGQPFMSKGDVQKYQIPLPPLEIQEQIVVELDGYAGIIAGAKQITQNWKPKIDIDPEWEMVKIGDLVKNKIIEKPLDGNHGEIHPKASDYVQEGIPFIMANDLVNGLVDIENSKKITEKQAACLRTGFAKNGDVLFTHKGTIGRTAILNSKYQYVVLTPQVTYYRVINENLLINKFLKIYFDSVSFQLRIQQLASIGATRAYIGITDQLKLDIVLPPIEIQKQIVEKIEAERALVDGNKKLIEIYEQKTKDVIAKLWEE